MLPTPALALVPASVALYWVFTLVSGLLANIAKAKRTNLRYLVVFCSPNNYAWYELQKLVLPILKLVMPASWWDDWLFIMKRDWAYQCEQEPWDRLGDSFLVVTPGSLVMYTRSPDVIRQVTSRRDDFGKPTDLYRLLAGYGDNVLTTEGAAWRLHRRATTTAFTERSIAQAYSETVYQTQAMVRKWRASTAASSIGDDSNGDLRTIHTIASDIMKLSLHVVGSVGFGMRFLWPGEQPTKNSDPRMLKYTTVTPGGAHSMAFPDSLGTVLDMILPLAIFPPWLLRTLPFRWAKIAYEAHDNFSRYMDELLRQRKVELRHRSSGESKRDQGMDIMGTLLNSSNSREEAAEVGAKLGDPVMPPSPLLSDAEIIGNAFILILAGHETSADVLHFALVHLACNPASQRALQTDLDRIVGHDRASGGCGASADATPSWDRVGELLCSMAGAVVNETLRLMPPVVEIPKRAHGDQALAVGGGGGSECIVPAGTNVLLVAVAAHRHPCHWPPGESGVSDVNEWVPERWFRKSRVVAVAAFPSHEDYDCESEVAGIDTLLSSPALLSTQSASRAHFRPVRGAFVPYSDGSRSCLGRRMAQVELVASLAVIMGRYSVELAVDDWANDNEVERMELGERAELYDRARRRARAVMGRAYTVLSLKLQDGAHIPVRLVRRGRERFVGAT